MSSPTQAARVTAVHRDQCQLRFADGERTAQITGRFRFLAESASDFPAVGDWVEAEIVGPDFALVHALRPRTTVISRRAPGEAVEEQVLAANVDTAFIVTSFNQDFNPRRLERYLALARQAGATPAILINKSDLADADDARFSEAAAADPTAAVYRVSALTGEGIDAVAALVAGDRTGVFLGSSGVGKSTILNALLGKDVQPTQTIRLSDARGRHTTTARQMFSLPNGGFIIDTPGLREIQLWADESALDDVFADVAALAARCQFADCRHETEPGCAVRAALASGALEAGRWAGYLKLQKELAYLKRRQDPEQQANTKKRWKKIHKDLREILRRKRG